MLIEAAACDVPVVDSQADGSCEALLDGQLGRLVDPKKRAELVEAVTGILEIAPSRRRNDAIDYFSFQNFKARVADWCHTQVVPKAA